MAHPLQAWRAKRERSRADVAGQADTSPGYLALIEQGWRRPSFTLAETLSAITQGDVGAIELLRYPLRVTHKKPRRNPNARAVTRKRGG